MIRRTLLTIALLAAMGPIMLTALIIAALTLH